jgi:MoaA/NifB/PqqE/SkfB family radical SAM enzyme
MEGIIPAWGRILRGYRPALSVEITRECPLRCPGCYAYGDDHLGGDVTLRQISDFKGPELIERFFTLIDAHRPIHVSIVGGEPLVRYRELNEILPRLAAMGIYTQVVTSAVRPVPAEWAAIRRLQIVVSIDGLQPEHDARRKPATYDRILKHIKGQRMTVHCTVTRQQARRDGYLDEFVRFWSANPDTHQIWVSLYTPQVGETSDERLTGDDRDRVIAALMHLRGRYPKLRMPEDLIEVYADPPQSPGECIFAQTTTCVSADFERRIAPCQFGAAAASRRRGLARSDGIGSPAACAWACCSSIPSGLAAPYAAYAETRRADILPRGACEARLLIPFVWRISHHSISPPASISRKWTTRSTRREKKSRNGTTSRARAPLSISTVLRTP